MTGIAYKPSGADFDINAGDSWLADREGLILENRFGGSAASLKNWADGGVDGVAEGALVFGANDVTLQGNAAPNNRRINTGVVVPAGMPGVTFCGAFTKGGAIAILESVYVSGSTYRTGFRNSSTTVALAIAEISGMPTLAWPADIGSKMLWVCGHAQHKGFTILQMGLDGDRLATTLTSPGGPGDAAVSASALTGTPTRFPIPGSGELWYAREGGGAGTAKAGFGAVLADAKSYDWKLESYKRAFAILGSGVLR